MAQLSTPTTARFVPSAPAQLDLAMDDSPALPDGRRDAMAVSYTHLTLPTKRIV